MSRAIVQLLLPLLLHSTSAVPRAALAKVAPMPSVHYLEADTCGEWARDLWEPDDFAQPPYQYQQPQTNYSKGDLPFFVDAVFGENDGLIHARMVDNRTRANIGGKYRRETEAAGWWALQCPLKAQIMWLFAGQSKLPAGINQAHDCICMSQRQAHIEIRPMQRECIDVPPDKYTYEKPRSDGSIVVNSVNTLVVSNTMYGRYCCNDRPRPNILPVPQEMKVFIKGVNEPVAAVSHESKISWIARWLMPSGKSLIAVGLMVCFLADEQALSPGFHMDVAPEHRLRQFPVHGDRWG